MTKIKTMFALIAILAIGATTMSFALAQPIQDTFQISAAPTAGIRVEGPIPDIKGTVDVSKNILSSAKVGFAEASAIAETHTKGHVINGNLGIQNGYLVYTFSTILENEMRTVLVDAGDGKVLHTSEPITADTSVLLLSGGQPMFFSQAMPTMLALQSDGNFTFEQQK